MSGGGVIRWPVVAGILSLIVIVTSVVYFCFFWVPEGCDGSRVSWQAIKWCNVNTLGAQLRADLPPGTKRQVVEAYLRRAKIPFTPLPPIRSTTFGSIGIMRHVTADWGGTPNGSLSVVISFAEDDGIAKIDFVPNMKVVLELHDLAVE